MSSPDFHGGDEDVVYSPKDNKRQVDIFKLQLFFMRFVGQVPMNFDRFLPKSLHWIGRWLANFYCALCVFSSSHLAILFLKTTFDMFQNGQLEEITDALTMTIIYGFAAFATCYCLWRSKRLIEFIDDINAYYRHHSMAGITFVSAKRSIDLAHNITFYWLVACASGVTCWGLAPLLLGSHTLPLKCWYPFDSLQPLIYELLYAMQLWCQLVMGCIFGSSSAFFVSMAIVMLGQFDVLYCSLKNVDYHAHLIVGRSLNKLRLEQRQLPPASEEELNQYLFLSEHVTDLDALALTKIKIRKTLRDALHDALIECVHMHQFILKSCDILEELFNPFCLVKSIQITFQLCLLAFVGVAGERSFMRIVNLVQYLALTLSELLMFTYCGELLSNHSIRAGEAFWRSQWWVNGHLIKRDIFIFLTNSKRPVRMTAGKFYVMDIQRLRSVIAQAFSFLTLLQKLAEKNK